MDEKKTQPAAAVSQLTEMHAQLVAERDARQPGARGVTLLRFLINMGIGVLLGVIAWIVLNQLHIGAGRMRFCLIWGAVIGAAITLHQVSRVKKLRQWTRSPQTLETLRKLRQGWLNDLRSACSRMRQQYQLRPKTAASAAQKQTAPAQSQPAQKKTAPAQSQPAQKKTAPAPSQPAQKKTAPAPSQPAQKKTAPAQSQPAQKKTAPAPSQPAQKKTAPAQSQPAQKKNASLEEQVAALKAKQGTPGVRKPAPSAEEIRRRSLEAQVREAQAALGRTGTAPQPSGTARRMPNAQTPQQPAQKSEQEAKAHRERLIRSFREQMEEMERQRQAGQSGGKKK